MRPSHHAARSFEKESAVNVDLLDGGTDRSCRRYWSTASVTPAGPRKCTSRLVVCHFLITTTSRAIRLVDYCRAYTEIGWLARRDCLTILGDSVEDSDNVENE